jgi:chromosome segregation ATPase
MNTEINNNHQNEQNNFQNSNHVSLTSTPAINSPKELKQLSISSPPINLNIIKPKPVEQTSQIEHLENEIASLNQKIKTQNQMYLSILQESIKLQDEIQKYKDLYYIVKNSRELLQKQFQQYKDKYSFNITQLTEMSSLNSKFKEDIDKKEKQYQDIIDSNEKQYNLSISQYKKQIESIEHKYTDIITQHQQTQNELLKVNEQLALLTSKYDNVNNEKEKIKAMNTKLQKEISEYKNEIQALKKEINKLESKANNEKVTLMKNIQQLKKDFEEQKTIMESMHREEIDHLKFTQSLNYNQSRIKLEQTISNLKIELSHTKQQIEIMKKTVNELRKNTSSINNENITNVNNNNHNPNVKESCCTKESQRLTTISIEEEKTKGNYLSSCDNNNNISINGKLTFYNPGNKSRSVNHSIKRNHNKCNSTEYNFNKKIKNKSNRFSFIIPSSSQNIISSSNMSPGIYKRKESVFGYGGSEEKGKVTMSTTNLKNKKNYFSFGGDYDWFKTNTKWNTPSLPKVKSNKSFKKSPL